MLRRVHIGILLGVSVSMQACVEGDGVSAHRGDDASSYRATCLAEGCNGLEPDVTNCDDDAETLDSTQFPEGKLELRYSNSCFTKWAKVTRNDGQKLSIAWVETSEGNGKWETQDEVVWQFMWSHMWYSSEIPMRACARITSCTGDCDDPGNLYCTLYRVD